jgi:Lsr2
MVQRTVITLTCDLGDTEHEAVQTVRVGLDNDEREIDVCDDHAATIRSDLEPYLTAGRWIRGAMSKAYREPVKRTQARRAEMRDVRTWARANGLVVSNRGRIPADVIEKYEIARRK